MSDFSFIDQYNELREQIAVTASVAAWMVSRVQQDSSS